MAIAAIERPIAPRKAHLPVIPGVDLNAFSYLGHNLFGGVVEVTPDMAAAWLERNKGNRHVTATRVNAYASAIAEGLWRLNGEPALFDYNGTLRSFQHRALAIIKAQRSILTLVVVGVDPEVMPTIDTGKPRPAGTILGMRGVPNANAVAAVAAWVYRYRNDAGLNIVVEPIQLEQVLKQHPAILDWAAVTNQVRIRHFRRSLFAGIAYLCSRVDEPLARQMVEGMSTGDGLRKGSPIHTLRERFLANAVSRSGRLDPQGTWAYIVKAWNALYANRELHLLRFAADEEVPEIAGLDRASL